MCTYRWEQQWDELVGRVRESGEAAGRGRPASWWAEQIEPYGALRDHVGGTQPRVVSTFLASRHEINATVAPGRSRLFVVEAIALPERMAS